MTFGNTNTVLDGTIEICDIKNGNLDIKDGSGDNKEGARDIDDGILVVKDGTVANKRRSQYIKNGFPDMEVAVLKCSRLKTE